MIDISGHHILADGVHLFVPYTQGKLKQGLVVRQTVTVIKAPRALETKACDVAVRPDLANPLSHSKHLCSRSHAGSQQYAM